MRTVLLTGFEPFDQDTINPSWEAVRLLDGVLLSDDVRIVARQLPCAFEQAPERLRQCLADLFRSPTLRRLPGHRQRGIAAAERPGRNH